jgi:hypothetical protein
LKPEELADKLRNKLDNVGYDVYDDDGMLVFAAVMLEKAVGILRDKGSDGDILLAFSRLLQETENE